MLMPINSRDASRVTGFPTYEGIGIGSSGPQPFAGCGKRAHLDGRLGCHGASVWHA